MLEIPFLDCVIRYMALNHNRSGSLLDAKIVPAVIEVCLRQALHWYRDRRPRLTMQ